MHRKLEVVNYSSSWHELFLFHRSSPWCRNFEVRKLMPIRGGKDTHFNDRTVRRLSKGFQDGQQLENHCAAEAWDCLQLPLPNAEILRNFVDWVRDLMHKCGGKDVYFNDGTVVKGAFEGFLGPELERLNSQYEVLLYYIKPLCIESLRLLTTLTLDLRK